MNLTTFSHRTSRDVNLHAPRCLVGHGSYCTSPVFFGNMRFPSCIEPDKKKSVNSALQENAGLRLVGDTKHEDPFTRGHVRRDLISGLLAQHTCETTWRHMTLSPRVAESPCITCFSRQRCNSRTVQTRVPTYRDLARLNSYVCFALHAHGGTGSSSRC